MRLLDAGEIVATAPLAASGVASMTYFVGLVAGFPDPLPLVLALVAGALCAAGIAIGIRRARARSAPIPVLQVLMLAAVACVVVWQAVLLYRDALVAPFSVSDAWTVWGFKAKLLAAGALTPDYWRDPSLTFSSQNYPLNVPIQESLFLRIGGQVGISLAVLIGPLEFASLSGLFLVGLTRLYGPCIACIAVLALGSAPLVQAFVPIGYADWPLAAYGGAAVLYLLLWYRSGARVDLLLGGLFLGAEVWTKQEGDLAAGALLLVAIAVAFGDTGSRRARLAPLGLFLVALLLNLPWLVFSHIVQPLSIAFLPATPATFLANAGRLPGISRFFAIHMFDPSLWGVAWLTPAGLVFALALARRLSSEALCLFALIVLQLAAYMVTFVFSAWQPFTLHMTVTVDRLLLQLVPAVTLLLAELLSLLSHPRPSGWHITAGQ